jgi:hypothetical protein
MTMRGSRNRAGAVRSFPRTSAEYLALIVGHMGNVVSVVVNYIGEAK